VRFGSALVVVHSDMSFVGADGGDQRSQARAVGLRGESVIPIGSSGGRTRRFPRE
jgi:hypothetical protein